MSLFAVPWTVIPISSSAVLMHQLLFHCTMKPPLQEGHIYIWCLAKNYALTASLCVIGYLLSKLIVCLESTNYDHRPIYKRVTLTDQWNIAIWLVVPLINYLLSSSGGFSVPGMSTQACYLACNMHFEDSKRKKQELTQSSDSESL